MTLGGTLVIIGLLSSAVAMWEVMRFYQSMTRTPTLACALIVAQAGFFIAAIIVSRDEDCPGKVCVVQKRDIGGEWKCDEWRTP